MKQITLSLILISIFLLVLNQVFGFVTKTIDKPLINTSNSQPSITFIYNESVTITAVSLTKDAIYYNINNITTDNTTFIFTPEVYLGNGIYLLTITAEDIVGNALIIKQHIEINAPPMNIWTVSPESGVSNSSVFNITVETERDARCKIGYSTNTQSTTYQLPYFFNYSDNTLTTEHKRYYFGEPPFTINHNSANAGGKEETMRVECNDTYGLLHGANLIFGYDLTVPSLDVTINPLTIIDKEKPFAILNITTNDQTVCEYTENGISFTFENESLQDFESYKKKHGVILDFSVHAGRTEEEGLFEEEIFEYNISCTNLAGFKSSEEDLSLMVAFQKEFDIEMVSPEENTKTENIKFRIEPTVTASCTYGEGETENFDTDFTTNSMNLIYTAEFGPLGEGEYTYTVGCVTDYGFKTKVFTFIVDRTKPENITIEIENPYCSITKIEAEISADENYGIERYNYSVEKGGDIIISGSKGNGRISKPVALEEDTSYIFNAKAFDKAGNIGEGTTTFKAIAENATICDNKKPLTYLTATPTNQGMLVNIVCLDSESGCNNRFDYNTALSFENCSTSEGFGHNLGEEVFITKSEFLCWTVYDNNNNKASKIEFIEYLSVNETFPPHCFNTLKDGTETDINCGGDCQPCEGTNASCKINNDCATLSCNPTTSTCTNPACDNNYEDGFESDEDCGGNCDVCDIGSACEDNYDCASNICEYNVCAEDLDSDSDEDGMPDYWEEQHGFNPDDPTDAEEDSDNDEYTNLEEFKAGTDPKDKNSNPSKIFTDTSSTTTIDDDESNTISWVFIIIGLFLVIAGIVFLVIEKRKHANKQSEPRLISEKEKPLAEGILEEGEDSITSLPKEIFQKRTKEKAEQRKNLLKEFETEDEKEKESDVKITSVEKESDKNKKQTSITEKDVGDKENKRKGYIEVSELTKDKLEEGDIGKDVFQKLEMIGKEPTEEKEEPTEERETKEEEKKEDEIISEENIEQQELSLKKTEKEKEKEPEDLSQDDIFKKLAELSGQDHEEVRKAVDKEEVNSKDLLNVFANVTSKNQIDANVFKAILSQLLKKGQVSKQTVAEILFGFMDNELLTKKEISDLMRDLGLAGK